ncbi:MAG TPA: hypothetical protein VMI75_19770 [Polyangiaceae bacterium]|nr:hypothetical protein [Polyangiaceae bacterium]
MRRAIVVRGRLRGTRTIELEEPVEGVEEEVEVVLREAAEPAAEDDGESLVAVMHREQIDAAIAGKAVDVQVVYKPPPQPAVPGEEVTESPVVVVRRSPSSSSIRTPR